MATPAPNPIIAALSEYVLPPIAVLIDAYAQPLQPTRHYICHTLGLEAVYLDKSTNTPNGSFVFGLEAQVGEVARRILPFVISGGLIEMPHLNSAAEANRTLSYRVNKTEGLRTFELFLYKIDQQMRGTERSGRMVPIFELGAQLQDPQ